MRIKKSARGGLTFSFRENESFHVGTRYRYFVDLARDEVVLLPDDGGKYRMCRKGTGERPLVDLRNSEIRGAMEGANDCQLPTT